MMNLLRIIKRTPTDEMYSDNPKPPNTGLQATGLRARSLSEPHRPTPRLNLAVGQQLDSSIHDISKS